jgi:hypothetical protein
MDARLTAHERDQPVEDLGIGTGCHRVAESWVTTRFQRETLSAILETYSDTGSDTTTRRPAALAKSQA